MKLNMKRVALGLTMAVSLFSLSACSQADTITQKSEVSADVQAKLEQVPESFLQMYVSLQDSDVDAFKEKMNSIEQYAALADGADTWESIKPELGNLVSVGKDVTIVENEDGYTATVLAEFENKSLEFSVTTNPEITGVVSVSFDTNKAGGNSQEDLYGWLAVGAILLIIIFAVLRKKSGASDEVLTEGSQGENFVAAPATANSLTSQGEEINLADDLELVAVITAAIAASTGSSPSGLVVRSIRRAPAGKWKNA